MSCWYANFLLQDSYSAPDNIAEQLQQKHFRVQQDIHGFAWIGFYFSAILHQVASEVHHYVLGDFHNPQARETEIEMGNFRLVRN